MRWNRSMTNLKPIRKSIADYLLGQPDYVIYWRTRDLRHLSQRITARFRRLWANRNQRYLRHPISQVAGINFITNAINACFVQYSKQHSAFVEYVLIRAFCWQLMCTNIKP
jgi:hypothetical protein